MGRINQFLDEAGIFFLASEDGKQAKVRPLGAHVEINDKVYFTVGDFKEVYRQMAEDPYIEIVAYKPENRTWLRYTGRAVFEDNKEVEEIILEHLPHLRKAYNEQTGHKMMIFFLADARAQIYDMAGNIEVLEV